MINKTDKKTETSKKAKEIPKLKTTNVNKKLLKTLTDLAKQMEEDGLTLMIEQAELVLYKMKLIKRNKELESKQSKLDKPIEKYSPPSDKTNLEIVEADDDSHFIFVINRERNFFSLDEMKKIVKLCHVAENEKDGAERLYNWFERNRMDVINNTEIDGINDEALVTIYNGIIKSYTVKS